MKPFDLQAAMRGEAVQTRSGKPVRILCFDRKGGLPIIGLIADGSAVKEELTCSWDVNGNGSTVNVSHNDLFMATKKQEGWVNINNDRTTSWVFSSKAEADMHCSRDRIACIRIEWEE